jgi:hypothetical protein
VRANTYSDRTDSFTGGVLIWEHLLNRFIAAVMSPARLRALEAIFVACVGAGCGASATSAPAQEPPLSEQETVRAFMDHDLRVLKIILGARRGASVYYFHDPGNPSGDVGYVLVFRSTAAADVANAPDNISETVDYSPRRVRNVVIYSPETLSHKGRAILDEIESRLE